MVKKFIVVLACALSTFAFAGNEDRAGEAGAGELLINPWSRGSGMENANTASVKGTEGLFSNVAGLTHVTKSEMIFARTYWLKGSEIQVNAFGLTQRISDASVLALGISSMSFGEIPITTVDLPEGGIGSFSPNLMNINLAYAHAFSEHIRAGVNLKIIYESIHDVHAQSAAIDAGIQYITGKNENVKFGITLKNVGPKLSFNGNGISYRGTITGTSSTMTLEQRSAAYELPSLIKIGGAYDIYFNNDEKHVVTLAGTFTSNSFTKDQYSVGVEYCFHKILYLRGGYTYEKGIFTAGDRTNAHTGPGGGFSLDIPLNKDKDTKFGFDYSYRSSNPFSGTHNIGIRMSL